MGVSYSVRHAAALAEQLPASARVYTGRDLAGLNVTEALLSLIEFDARVLAWQQTEDARKGRNQPKPLFEFARSSEGEAMDIDSLEEMLSRPRREVR